eukprot:14311468-Alexandrium_andersonii.AAC.1
MCIRDRARCWPPSACAADASLHFRAPAACRADRAARDASDACRALDAAWRSRHAADDIHADARPN